MVLGALLVGGIAFSLGHWIGLGSLAAQQPKSPIRTAGGIDTANLYDPDYQGRVVAFVHGNVPITRAELAEYLIERFGAERLEFVVNRKIVELACKAKGIIVSDAEVEHHFKQDLAALGPHTTPKAFYDQILKPYRKTIFEYKEDVIRQRLAMSKLVEAELQSSITQADLLKTFEVFYGPKVQCRMIVYKENGLATKAWQRIRDSQNVEAAFIDEAKQQPVVELAAKGGELDKPIHKHFGDGIGVSGGAGRAIEKEAFSLKPGQMSQVIGMPDNTAIILLCQKHIPADPTKNFDNERLALLNATRQHKLGELTSQKLRQLRQDAAPRYLLTRPSADQLQREAQEELGKDLNFRGVDSK
jgi:hypothetical protein